MQERVWNYKIRYMSLKLKQNVVHKWDCLTPQLPRYGVGFVTIVSICFQLSSTNIDVFCRSTMELLPF